MLSLSGVVSLSLLTAVTFASPIDHVALPLIVRQDVQTPVNSSLPTVSIFATGGTIASKGTSSTQTIGYSIGLGVQDLIEAVPDILNISNINGYQVSNVGSPSINETILLTMAKMITEELAKEEISGVIITHGTSTIEETAFFMELAVNSSKPIIVVGAMRPATALSADGPLNLVQAVTLASSPASVGRGTMIVSNDRIGSAFYTSKLDANLLDTFKATEAGQLGILINQVPYFFYAPAEPVGRVFFNVSDVEDLAQVDIVYSHQDMNPKLFNASFESGAKGIVIAGTGAGGTSGKAALAAYELYNATGIPIVASHRSSDGFVPHGEDPWAIGGGFYNPQKARILLQLAISMGYSEDEIKEVFAKSYPMP